MSKITIPEPVAWAATDETCRVVEALGMNESRRFDSALYLSTQMEAYAAARVREALEWRPIETAPRDGTRVILVWGGESINGFFLNNSQSLRPWAGWRTESMVPAPIGQPTHWMPLPPPPQHDNE